MKKLRLTTCLTPFVLAATLLAPGVRAELIDPASQTNGVNQLTTPSPLPGNEAPLNDGIHSWKLKYDGRFKKTIEKLDHDRADASRTASTPGEAAPPSPTIVSGTGTDAPAWKMSGNVVSEKSVAYLGTLNAVPLLLGANSQPAFRIHPNNRSPNVVIGHPSNLVDSEIIGGVVGGGGGGRLFPNRVMGDFGTVAGGYHNQAGEKSPYVNASSATVSGGRNNSALQRNATVGGGMNNAARGLSNTIGGGFGNQTLASFATIAGGNLNRVEGEQGVVSGGYTNLASGELSAILGGERNAATGRGATIGGGSYNRAGGNFSTVAGGSLNEADGEFSFAGGHRAKARHKGSFVWADGQKSDFVSSDEGQFLIRAKGNVGIDTHEPDEKLSVRGNVAPAADNEFNLGSPTRHWQHLFLSGGVQYASELTFKQQNKTRMRLDPNGNLIVSGKIIAAGFEDASGQAVARSSGAAKPDTTVNGEFSVHAPKGTTFRTHAADTAGVVIPAGSHAIASNADPAMRHNPIEVESDLVLERLAELPIPVYNLKSQHHTVYHIGPTADDFNQGFGVGEKGQHINSADMDGVTLVAVQGLYSMVQAQKNKLAKQGAEIDDLKTQLNRLTQTLSQLQRTMPAPAANTP